MKKRFVFFFVAFCFVFFCEKTDAANANASADEKLIVHEWGTFTSLQDEDGNAIGGINTDDEPVPDFVHNLAPLLLIPASKFDVRGKGLTPGCNPDVTMRLETPVMYFHTQNRADANGAKNENIDVKVDFRGGWLTQFFPDANATAPGISKNHFAALTQQTIGGLEWLGLELNAPDAVQKMPKTDAHVWTTPRAVSAAMVKNPANGESEKFLFYRGVGHLDAPLRVQRERDELLLFANSDFEMQTPRAWLVDIRGDGSAAFRALPQMQLARAALQPPAAQTPAAFSPENYRVDSLTGLRAQMKAALISQGLFDDEAEAMLATWELSYFKSAGLRLFFIVPEKWTNAVLPLALSKPAEIKRVMIGRIELVTPQQRAALAQIARAPAMFSDAQSETLHRSYLALGRFRNALILDEQKRHPTEALANFINRYALEAYRGE